MYVGPLAPAAPSPRTGGGIIPGSRYARHEMT